MPIDHLAYAVPDLTDAVADIERRMGVRAARGGQHPGQGTHNALLALGDGRYLEIIAPDPGQPDPSAPRPFGVDPSGQPRLAGWAWRVDDIDAAVAHARSHGYDPGDPIDMHRLTTEGVQLNWRLTLNATGGGAVPFLIDWGDTPHPSASAPSGLKLRSLRIEHPDPRAIAAALTALGADADVDVGEAPDLTIIASFDGPTGTSELR
jgi:catechol 2,3-dioxygenase-like lactoylglutathione lyase family enzyme